MMNELPAPYKKLAERFREISLASSASEVLGWDQETYMPPDALGFRAEQMAYLAGASHRIFAAKTTGALIAACEGAGLDEGSAEAANIREWRRQFDRKTKIPVRLVEKFERTRTLAREAWREARARSEFGIFRPHLEKIVGLLRQFSDLWGYSGTPYNAHLDEYEPGARAEDLVPLFDTLQREIAALLPAAVERSAAAPRSLLEGHYPVAAQQAFNREVAEAMGFDFGAGRIDTAAHPFCAGVGPRDIRLTTRYSEEDFIVSLYGVMHEAGHGLYEQGLPREHYGTPAGSAASLGIHESQSRLWENQVGRDASFWRHWHPRACHYFPSLARLTPEQVCAAVNHVRPSFIRVEADQVTYDLHIALRFDIERRLIEGGIAAADVPAYWNERFEASFGMKVPSDAEGCLQDIHWSLGSFGYFPTYSLGNLNAAQLMCRARADLPGLGDALESGDYRPLLGWLRTAIHSHGQRHRAPELMRSATGEPTGSAAHLKYLREKFVG